MEDERRTSFEEKVREEGERDFNDNNNNIKKTYARNRIGCIRHVQYQKIEALPNPPLLLEPLILSSHCLLCFSNKSYCIPSPGGYE